jgi:hypothetical protein
MLWNPGNHYTGAALRPDPDGVIRTAKDLP